jgi:glycosyltransferase involved in cell wall biosynthesis
VRVTLFTHFFLEPTHYAIAQMLDAQREVEFDILARRFGALSNNMGGGHVRWRGLVGEHRFDDKCLESADVLHAIYDGDVVFDASRIADRLRKPLVVSLHGGFDTNAKIRDARYREASLDMLNRAQAITVVGATDRLRLLEWRVRAPIYELPVPVDMRLVKPARGAAGASRLLLVARLIDKKGVDIAINALARLPPDTTLTIVGDGPNLVLLQGLAERVGVRGRVRWLGHVPLEHVLAELAEADVLVHPARVARDGNAEGTPQIVLWAQAAGVPVVTTDTGSIRDVIDDNESGLLVSPDVGDVAGAIWRLLRDRDLRDRLVASAKGTARKHHLPVAAGVLGAIYRRARSTERLHAPARHVDARTREALELAAAALGIGVDQLVLAGEGGHGCIYYVLGLGRDVAVKTPAYDAHAPERASVLEHKLLREFDVLTLAANPGLPSAVACDKRGRFLARSYLRGEPLSRAQRYVADAYKGVLLDDLFDLARSLFPAFHGSDRGSYLLRDFKPQNIIVGSGATRCMQFVDVGAVQRKAEVSLRAWDRARLGTGQWRHWPPEQLLGDGPSISEAVDFFALGVSAYFVLTGAMPYENRCADVDGVHAAYAEQYLRAASALRQRAKTLSVDPNDVETILGWLIPDAAKRSVALPTQRRRRAGFTPAVLFGLEHPARSS